MTTDTAATATATSKADPSASTSSAPAPVKKQRKPRFKKQEFTFPVEPRIIQVVKKPKTFVDHSYRDFSIVPSDLKYSFPTEIDQMSFAEKVHHMLSDERYTNWIQWLPHGRGFKITVPKRLEQSRVLQKYFGHNRFSSFLRQLNNHGFKHVTRGVDRNSYYHECFLRGMQHLLKYMPPGRDARRLMPDPDNEPDFYAISRVCPLPAEKPVASGLEIAQGTPSTPSLQPNNPANPLQNLLGPTPQIPSLALSMQALQQQPQGLPSQQQQMQLQQQQMQLQQQAASLQAQQQQHQQQQQQQGDSSLYSPLLNGGNQGLSQQGGFPQGNLSMMMNNNGAQTNNNNGMNLAPQQGQQQQQQQQAPPQQQQQQLDDPALLALLLRSRGPSGGNPLFGLQG